MQKKRFLSGLVAVGLAVASLPMGAVQAEALTGDVNMDGIITGYDAALVSKYLLEGDVELTKEQLAIADMNGDGKVTVEDADAIFEAKTYLLGDIDHLGGFAKANGEFLWKEEGVSRVSIEDAKDIMLCYTYRSAGYEIGEGDKYYVSVADGDMNANGVIDGEDGLYALTYYACWCAGLGVDEVMMKNHKYYFGGAEGYRYDFVFDNGGAVSGIVKY